MSFQINPLALTDAYKFDHRRQYPQGTEGVYSNITARGSRIPGIDKVVFFGLQAFIQSYVEKFNENFFNRPEGEVAEEYAELVNGILGPNGVGTDHVRALHKLGYLPLEFKALPEGTRVPLRLPMVTVENTLPDFFWLVNYVETVMSSELWLPSTSATTAYHLRELLDAWAAKTSSAPDFVDFQGHDFSARGMQNSESAMASGAGHLLSFRGSDTVAAIPWIDYYYAGDNGFIGGSVTATEHSVMCAGGDLNEQDTFEYLMETYPTGILAVVSDTWDLWSVLTKLLPNIKDKVLARDGKLVIRPDSGDPVDILCGQNTQNGIYSGAGFSGENGEIYDINIVEPSHYGVIELLWKVFGGTINEKGYKELDPHIGAIYGDAITYDRADEISKRLELKGFASTNVVFGVGSFTYTYVTRDTFGFAMKATWAKVNGEARNLFKDPVTDSGLKRSATGRLSVVEQDGELALIQKASQEDEDRSLLELVWRDGAFYRYQSFDEVRKVLHG